MTHADGGKRYWVATDSLNRGRVLSDSGVLETIPVEVVLASDYARLEQQVEQLQGELDRLKDRAYPTATEYNSLLDMNEALQNELEGLKAFKRSVDGALNSGDGTYRP